MEPSRAALPAWRTLLWLALALLLVDVAARRLAWDALLVRRSVRRATARIEPHDVRGREAAATLASLRHASVQVEQPRPIRAVMPVVQPPTPTPAVHKIREPTGPDPAKVAAALDALAGKSPPAKPAEEQPDQHEPSEPPSTSETMSGLLAAKRRTRHQQ